MCVPLRDQYGKVRYFLGAQLDITGLIENCIELDSLHRLVEQQNIKAGSDGDALAVAEAHQHDAFEQLSETFNPRELETLLASRQLSRPTMELGKDTREYSAHNRAKDVQLKNSSADLKNIFQLNGQGSAPPLGFYQNVSASIMKPFQEYTDRTVPACSTSSITSNSVRIS